MIIIKSNDIDSELFKSELIVEGSGKEIIRDFYALFDALEQDRKFKLLYKLAKLQYEKNRGNHEN